MNKRQRRERGLGENGPQKEKSSSTRLALLTDRVSLFQILSRVGSQESEESWLTPMQVKESVNHRTLKMLRKPAGKLR